jgi:hypothetical protein
MTKIKKYVHIILIFNYNGDWGDGHNKNTMSNQQSAISHQLTARNISKVIVPSTSIRCCIELTAES